MAAVVIGDARSDYLGDWCEVAERRLWRLMRDHAFMFRDEFLKSDLFCSGRQVEVHFVEKGQDAFAHFMTARAQFFGSQVEGASEPFEKHGDMAEILDEKKGRSSGKLKYERACHALVNLSEIATLFSHHLDHYRQQYDTMVSGGEDVRPATILKLKQERVKIRYMRQLALVTKMLTESAVKAIIFIIYQKRSAPKVADPVEQKWINLAHLVETVRHFIVYLGQILVEVINYAQKEVILSPPLFHARLDERLNFVQAFPPELELDPEVGRLIGDRMREVGQHIARMNVEGAVIEQRCADLLAVKMRKLDDLRGKRIVKENPVIREGYF